MAKKARLALSAKSSVIDPALDALFSSRSGPVKPSISNHQPSLSTAKVTIEPQPAARHHGKTRSSEAASTRPDKSCEADAANTGKGPNDRIVDEGHHPVSDSDNDVANSDLPRRKRKRPRNLENEDLEANHLAALAENDGPETSRKRPRTDLDGQEQDEVEGEGKTQEHVPMHESLAQDGGASELERATRTVFLGNVSNEAVSSKKAKKTLLAHLSSILDRTESSSEKIESIRFRSLAFSTSALPKRAAFITKSLMDTTTKSANAYVVYSSPAAARKAVAELNGSEVLGRHIRIDSVAHPSALDHRRCVFVGNLGFVDDETVLSTDKHGGVVSKKRTKVPADVEEGLWRTFGKQGRVGNVRVVRDPKTRIGKGFAYVQFYDGNAVESALLLDGKKFPPLLPRSLRVTRAKDPRKTALAQERARSRAKASEADSHITKYKPKSTPQGKAAAGRAGRLLGRAGAALQQKSKASPFHSHVPKKKPEEFVLEGRRASARDGRPKDLRLGKKLKRKTVRPKGRSAKRAADWKKKKGL